jgi:Gram-negative bacterial TonB protein C-terminal
MKTKWKSQGGFFVAACAMILGVTLFCAPQARGDSKKDAEARAKAEAMIQKAIALSDLRAPGSQPFMLAGEINIHQPDGSVAHGTYLLKWASPDKWHEDIKFSNYSRTRWGGHDEYFQVRSIDYEAISIYALTQVLQYADRLPMQISYLEKEPKNKFSIKNEQIKGSVAQCIVISEREWDMKSGFCFDTQGALVREQGTVLTPGYDSVEIEGFNPLHGKIFPQSFRVLREGHTTLDFQTTQFGPLPATPDSEFIPPSNAQQFGDCPVRNASEIPFPFKQTLPAYPEEAVQNHISGSVEVYALIGIDGRLHGMKVVASPDPLLTKSTLAAISHWEYKPAVCRGYPENEETIVTVVYNIGR